MSKHPLVALSKLQLHNFRNYARASFEFNADIVAISGDNGIGKTNILEAITLLTKGRGLRGAEFDDMIKDEPLAENFTIFAQIKNHPQIETIGTTYSNENSRRIFQINGKNIENLKISPTIIWLTPQMDSLFLAPKNVRRKFLDRIVFDIDPSHSTRINSYDKLLRERIHLLTKYHQKKDDKWLEVIERKIAELGSAIAISRNEASEYLNRAMLLNQSDFIKTKIKIIGELEELALENTALFVEEEFVKKLKENRDLDSRTGRTNFGTHRSEFTALLLNKNIEARHCSTGEQKSILIALTFARIEIFSFLNFPSALLLLDEIASHLDNTKRLDLFKEISRLNAQCFLTGTSQEIFSDLQNNRSKIVQFLHLNK